MLMVQGYIVKNFKINLMNGFYLLKVEKHEK